MNPPPQDPLAVLRRTFPGWYIDHDTVLGRWIAMRYRPLTVQETTTKNRWTAHPLFPLPEEYPAGTARPSSP
ncbi:hypothetical protein [Streptosporangium amethystogenes]|uniref:hypothetical protein n=1 Tax=Streptosporangium amethystogenes TaxID=2002 RepID=UPI0012FBE99B|nr:hypothetical protein [Streptosporangium amethystogenes]